LRCHFHQKRLTVVSSGVDVGSAAGDEIGTANRVRSKRSVRVNMCGDFLKANKSV
jgi:hypothetical protein